MLLALTRDVSPTFDQCELTHVPRTPIDVAEARRQHSQYKQSLRELGCHVISLPGPSSMPDAVFVEDTAVVLDELTVICRPGVESRRTETAAVGEFFQQYRKLVFIEGPGCLDGGDVLRLGKTLYVGLSSRTNESGIEQLGAAVAAAGYKVQPLELTGCLHLKSAVTRVAEKQILVNPGWIDPAKIAGHDVVEVAPDEPAAANALRVNDKVVYPSQHPKTMGRLRAAGLKIRQVDVSQFLKAEGGVTCGSILFQHPPVKSSSRG